MAFDNCSAAKLISSSVLNLPKLKRIEECASCSLSPRDNNTCEGSVVLVVHADPADIATVFEVEFIIALLSMPSNLMLML